MPICTYTYKYICMYIYIKMQHIAIHYNTLQRTATHSTEMGKEGAAGGRPVTITLPSRYIPLVGLVFASVFVSVCGGVLLRVAVCCSVLRCAAVRCSMLQRVAVCCSMLQFVAVFCSVFQCVAVWCSMMQCVAMCCSVLRVLHCVLQCVLQCFAVCCSGAWPRILVAEYCSVWQCVAVRCSALQCVAVRCSGIWLRNCKYVRVHAHMYISIY